jgi:hypothetical protein
MKVKTAGRNKEAETKEEASREIMLAFLEWLSPAGSKWQPTK